MAIETAMAIEEDGISPIVLCCGGLCGCIAIAGAVTLSVFWIIFLVNDEGKGGICADTTGHAIWVYCIVKMVTASCIQGGQANKPKSEDVEADTMTGAMCVILCNLGLLIYGGIVIIYNDPCDQYKNTGLYQMVR